MGQARSFQQKTKINLGKKQRKQKKRNEVRNARVEAEGKSTTAVDWTRYSTWAMSQQKFGGN